MNQCVFFDSVLSQRWWCFLPAQRLSRDDPAATPKPDFTRLRAASPRKTRGTALSAIKQARAIPFEEEDLHGEGWEFYGKSAGGTMAAPSYTSKHSFSIDSVHSPAAAAVAPVLKSKFAASPTRTSAQPDCIITVGPNHIMIAVKPEVAIYTKSGQKLFQTSFAEWFGRSISAQ